MNDDPLADYIPEDELARRRQRQGAAVDREADRKHRAFEHIAAIRQQLKDRRR
jgi:hypothetical protein